MWRSSSPKGGRKPLITCSLTVRTSHLVRTTEDQIACCLSRQGSALIQHGSQWSLTSGQVAVWFLETCIQRSVTGGSSGARYSLAERHTAGASTRSFSNSSNCRHEPDLFSNSRLPAAKAR